MTETLQNPNVPPVMFTSLMKMDLFNVQYPDHAPRRESGLFKKSRDNLIVKLDTPCYICGVSYSKGGAMEAHHCCVEWAAANAIDWKKFQDDFSSLVNPQQSNLKEADFNWSEVAKNSKLYVDSIYNLLVLCFEHHRSTKYGIHFVPYPIWILQKWPTNGFEFIPRT